MKNNEIIKSRTVVLIPFYMDLLGLRKSLKSIKDKETVDILIVDDGSTIPLNYDDIKDIEFRGNISIITMQNNVGIENALNEGLKSIELSDYDYIGRLDSGDTCEVDRFYKQIEYLDKNPDVILLGSWANYIDESNETFLYVLKHPCKDSEIRYKMKFNSCFVHPSVVFRRKVIEIVGCYPVDFKYAEDYAYFYEVMKVGKVENYPEALVNYYVSDKSISTLRRKQQIKSRIKVIKKNVPFSLTKLVSIVRNTILLYTSRSIIIKIKKYVK